MIFLRPWALLLALIPFLYKGVKHFGHSQTPWSKFIDKKLLPALLVKSKSTHQKRFWNWQMYILWFMWSIALAGPAFYKLPTPSVESAPNTIIVFDLSLQGNELLQGQAKLYDLLSALRGERVGLVVYGQNQGYTAMPLTPDIGLVKEIVPTLAADVLPEPALNPKAGFEYAAKLLDNAGGKGRLLYVTDKPINWSGRYPFGILDLNQRTADESDIQRLLTKTKKAESTTVDTTFSTTTDVWADLGGWVVLFSLPFFAFMFRKGILFLLPLFLIYQAEAGFFWRPDQEIYKTEKKAISAYQKKDYKTASALFRQSENLYNLGNALAFSGDIQSAINAYTEELKKNPNNQDALFNKEYLEKQLPPPDQQQKQNEDGESENNKNETNENSDENQQENNQQQDQQDEQNSSDESQEQNQTSENKEKESEENKSDSQPTQDETQQELEKALAEYENEKPYNQEEQQIINRLNHDPSRVLRYRLLLQHQKGLLS